MWQSGLDSLLKKDAALAELLELIRSLATTARELPFEPFREPVALLDLTKGKGNNKITNLDSWYLSSWCKHMAYSMRVRMLSLEDGILGEIAHGRFLGSQVLLRSHLEAAAMTALCIQSVNKAKTDPEWESLRDLIPKTLFGTSLYTGAQKDDRLREFLMLSEQRTITIRSAIDALDTFTFEEEASGQLNWLYARLCEASHPNHRGTSGFATSRQVDENGEHGWIISYGPVEDNEPLLIRRLLETLLLSMRQGYAASEILRTTIFENVKGRTVFRGVPLEDLDRIWLTLLQRVRDDHPPSP